MFTLRRASQALVNILRYEKKIETPFTEHALSRHVHVHSTMSIEVINDKNTSQIFLFLF